MPFEEPGCAYDRVRHEWRPYTDPTDGERRDSCHWCGATRAHVVYDGECPVCGGGLVRYMAHMGWMGTGMTLLAYLHNLHGDECWEILGVEKDPKAWIRVVSARPAAGRKRVPWYDPEWSARQQERLRPAPVLEDAR